MSLIEKIHHADWERIQKVPVEQRQAWKKALSDAVQRFENYPVIHHTAEARRRRAVRIITEALSETIAQNPEEKHPSKYYFFKCTSNREELSEFFHDLDHTGLPDDRGFLYDLAKEQSDKPCKEWDSTITESYIRRRYCNNVFNIRGMIDYLGYRGEFDKEMKRPLDSAFQALSSLGAGKDLIPNGNSCYDWNQLGPNLRRAYVTAPEGSAAHKLFSVILKAAKDSGLFEAIEQAYGNTDRGSYLTV